MLIRRNGLSYILLDVFNTHFERILTGITTNEKEKFGVYYHTGGIYNFLILWMENGMEILLLEITEIAISIFPNDYISFLMPYLNPKNNKR